MQAFQLKIPSSTSNVGPGFDTLGIALNLYNRLEVRPGGKGMSVRFASGVKPIFQKKVRAMVQSVAKAFEQKAGVEGLPVRLVFRNEVPIARGLGSSATFRMGALVAINMLAGEPLTGDDLLGIGCALEKHTENCVASLFGGLTVSGFIGQRVAYASYNLERSITFVAAVPRMPVSTRETRKLVPRRVSMKDAVFNLNRTALLIHALVQGKYESLDDLLEDRFHQPYRAKVITPLFDVIQSARDAGAWGGFLSGSGSTIVALASGETKKVGQAMKKVLDSKGWPSRIHYLVPENNGIQISHE